MLEVALLTIFILGKGAYNFFNTVKYIKSKKVKKVK